MPLLPPPEEPEPLDPGMTAEHADGELLELNMLEHRDEVAVAWVELHTATEELFCLPPVPLAGIDGFDRFRAVEFAAEEVARRAHDGAARWHRWLHGEDSDL